MSNAALDPSLWEELTSNQAPGGEALTVPDELDASRGIIWWNFASLLFWLMLAAVVL
jgi:hypothetical protein